jgi:maltooligosyltrehalose trehalohydrolase
MSYRDEPRGEPSAQLPPTAFVAFIQNHDQIGNRALGERLITLVPPAALRAIAATCLLLPQVPMLFMGEEWGCSRPFLYFCDFGADLADKVRAGRRAEFARFRAFRDAEARERIPDPLAESTFQVSKLDWRELEQPGHAAWLSWYRALLEVRRAHLVPLLPGIRHGASWRTLAPAAVQLRWDCGGGGALALAVNLGERAVSGFQSRAGRVLWQEGAQCGADELAPWSVRCWLEPR